MARSILSQLLAQDDSLLLHLEKAMDSSPTQSVLTNVALSKELLDIALKSRKTYIILDGIDECSRDVRKDICSWFRAVVEALPRTNQDEIRCLFISQDDGVGRKDLSMLPTLMISPSHNRDDIQRFSRAGQDRIEARLGPCPLDKSGLGIAQVVAARSQGTLLSPITPSHNAQCLTQPFKGMFIFAKCVIEELEQYLTKESIQHDWSAEGFPAEMEQV